MSRLRSLSFPRIAPSRQQHDDTSPVMTLSYQCPTAHSRDSSATSSSSSPLTPTFSTRGHSRYPSSCSSLASNPESPSTAPASKTTLHDLVEDPAERDEPLDEPRASIDELCICDTPFCSHRQRQPTQTTPVPMGSPEWSPGDDYFSDGQLGDEHTKGCRKSGSAPSDSLSTRLSRHFPSISKRFQGHRATSSVSTVYQRSAPPSRASSLRLPSKRSVTEPLAPETRSQLSASPLPPANARQERSMSPLRERPTSTAASTPMDVDFPRPPEDPIDREQLSSTPLLPPMTADYFNGSAEAMHSPLQSPTVANSIAASVANTPVGTPVLSVLPTPPLSAKPSVSSLRNTKPGAAPPSSEIPPLTISEEADPWARKLGHANFHIRPEPYVPDVCNRQTCKRLQDDWEAAQLEYMRQASRISEHYGVTSQTYRLTQEKWAEIDARWRASYEAANELAQASGDSPLFHQPLAETQALSKMPSLNNPAQPAKFPQIEENDIVGPMVRYAKIQHEQRQFKKPTLLRIFTDPTSLLASRSNTFLRK